MTCGPGDIGDGRLERQNGRGWSQGGHGEGQPQAAARGGPDVAELTSESPHAEASPGPGERKKWGEETTGGREDGLPTRAPPCTRLPVGRNAGVASRALAPGMHSYRVTHALAGDPGGNQPHLPGRAVGRARLVPEPPASSEPSRPLSGVPLSSGRSGGAGGGQGMGMLAV